MSTGRDLDRDQKKLNCLRMNPLEKVYNTISCDCLPKFLHLISLNRNAPGSVTRAPTCHVACYAILAEFL